MQRLRRKLVLGACLAGVGCQGFTGAHERRLIGETEHDGGAGGGSGAAGAGNTAGSAGSAGNSGVGGAGNTGGAPDGGAHASGGTGGSGAADAAGGSGGTGAAGTGNTATSCAELAVRFGVHQDGIVTIDSDGAGTAPPFEVFCNGMAIEGGAAAAEFLVLPRHNGTGSPDSNFVTFGVDTQIPPRPGACACPPLTMDFSAVRFDLGRLRIFAYDRSYVTYRGDRGCHASVANPCCKGGITNFGEAASCVAPLDSSGSANIDLRGTPFHLAEGQLFEIVGSTAAGSVEISADRKLATVRGGGGGGESGSYGPIGGEIPLAFDVFTDACGTETPASVSCGLSGSGALGCVPAMGCCIDGDGKASCNDGSSSPCDGLGFPTEFFCDDQADCSDGKVCCLNNSGVPKRSTCKTGCFGTDSQLCTTCRECGAGRTCVDNRCVLQR